ncbi:MAG: methyltransferase domain-containing protein [Deltaproteobacteria bacterium]|nr:methyltransferase domain-containing protein [Deltaproteobacteria bacterium]MBW2413673.1 methyltransferase domain-containing protein [Deltaproteobacteria bacterium]
MTETRSRVDGEKLQGYLRNVFGTLGGAMTSAMVYLGDRMQLFEAMAGEGPMSSEELAQKTGLSERWLREWLHGLGAADLLEYTGDGRFWLTPEGEAVLVNEDHPANGAGFFSQLPRQMAIAERLPEAFKSGVGLNYDELGSDGAIGIERGLAPFFRTMMVPALLPRVDGLVERLERGAQVADVGCGGGVALIEMARAYPKSEYHGYDISKHALERAASNLREAGLDNVTFHDASVDPLPSDQRFDVVTTFDCLHDMTDPASVMRQIRAAIRPDGIWLIADIKARATYEENVERNPMAALMYATSVLVCMSSGLSEADGLGLGTLGLHPDLARKMTEEAGFASFETVDLDHPANAFYAVRP